MNGEEYSPSVQLLLTVGDRGPVLLGVEQHAQEPDGSCGGECLSGLLETSFRIDVWPDSVQVSDGLALFWAAHPLTGCGSLSVCSPSDTVDEAWLQRGLPSS